MFYKIIGVRLHYGSTDETENLYPLFVEVTLEMESGEVKAVNPELGAGDMRQFENILRQKIDAALNGE